MEGKYWITKNGKVIEVPPIKEICESLEEKFTREEATIAELAEENRKLKEGVWKQEEVARLKEKYEKMHKELMNGFAITDEEAKQIKEWRKTHGCKYRGLKIGATCHYEFHPTALGTFGEIICSCGEKFTFQEP